MKDNLASNIETFAALSVISSLLTEDPAKLISIYCKLVSTQGPEFELKNNIFQVPSRERTTILEQKIKDLEEKNEKLIQSLCQVFRLYAKTDFIEIKCYFKIEGKRLRNKI